MENVYDYTDAIGELKPKVASSIVVNRKGETLELDIIPKARD